MSIATSKVIGLSVSFCIRDIIDGKVEEAAVEKIIANTRCYTRQDWESVIERYRQWHWRKNPEVGEAICWRFVAAEKFDQPRCRGEESHNISQGHWIVNGEQVRL